MDSLKSYEKMNYYEYIEKCKKKDKTALAYMANKFKPLIRKYSYLLNYNDAEQDLWLALIEVLEQMPLEKIAKGNSEPYILGYIKTSIKNKYIYLSKRKYLNSFNQELNDDICSHNPKLISSDIESSIFLQDSLKHLTEQQKKIITLKYVYGYSDIEISKMLNKTRQSVNKVKLRALQRLQNFMS